MPRVSAFQRAVARHQRRSGGRVIQFLSLNPLAPTGWYSILYHLDYIWTLGWGECTGETMAGNERRNNAFHTQIKKSVVSDFWIFRFFSKKIALDLGDPPSDLAKSGPGGASGTPWRLSTEFWTRFGIPRYFSIVLFHSRILSGSARPLACYNWCWIIRVDNLKLKPISRALYLME
jgi:hypothetical protein